MSPIGQQSGVCNGPAQSLAVRTRATQKLKAASGLQDGLHDETPSRQDFHQAREQDGMTCSGTVAAVPFRHAPRLMAPFVAQLLGQLLPDCERPRTGAAQAYSAEGISSSLLLDTRL